MNINHCLDQYSAEITALFIPYLMPDITETKWMYLQKTLSSKIGRMCRETLVESVKHLPEKKKTPFRRDTRKLTVGVLPKQFELSWEDK